MRTAKVVMLAIHTITLLGLMSGNLVAQLIEEKDPTATQFEIVRGSGDPNYTGALDMKIPLMKIPGRGGLDFDLNLIYVDGNGVPASESESWAGLGWNLNMYQITCSPNFDKYGGTGTTWYSLTSTGQDLYHLSYPGGSTSMYNFGGTGWLPLNWSAIKIQSEDDPNTNTSDWHIDKDYKRFVVTDVDGTRYIFADRLRQESEEALANHCTGGWLHTGSSHGFQGPHPYYYVFKLSAILGPNYIDGNGDDTPGNGGTDKGSWIRLQYTASVVMTNRTAASNYGSTTVKMETNYLSIITTPTHTATFNTVDGSNFIYQGHQNGTLQRLSNIQLSPGGTKVEFFSRRQFAWAKRVPGANYALVQTEGGSDVLRSGLDSVRIISSEGPQRLPAYQFEYTGNPSEANGAMCYLDPWGYYSTQSPTNPPLPYKWDCWLLKKVTYPTGATAEFQYESNRYEKYSTTYVGDYEKLGGGVRLKQQTLTDPLTGASSTYTYQYALTNNRFPGYGFVSLEPMFFSSITSGVVTQGSMGKNLRTDVHYPDVQITMPDGSRIRRYYTSAFSGVVGDPPSGQSYTPYTNYSKSYANVAVDPDNDMNSLLVDGAHPQNGLFHVFNILDPYPPDPALLPNTRNRHFLTPNANYLTTTTPEGYLSEKNAFMGEASEFDDEFNEIWFKDGWVYLSIFDNSWKRGYLTCEELYMDPGQDPTFYKEPVQKKIFYYTMTPMKSEICQVEASWNSQSGCPDCGDNASPTFVTSGWVKQTGVDYYYRQINAERVDQQKKERFEYNTKNGLVSKEIVGPYSLSPQRITFSGYACESNTGMDALHMWSQKALTAVGDQTSTFNTTLTGNTQIMALTQTQWYNDNGRWLPDKILKWKDTNGNKNVDATDDMITAQDFISYDDHGNPLEIRDANGIPKSFKYEFNSTIPIALASNAAASEFSVLDFEDGTSGDWTVSGGEVYNSAHTGDFSWYIYGTSYQTISKTFSSAALNGAKKYTVSGWVFTTSTRPNLRWYVKYNNGTSEAYPLTVSAAGTGQWQYLESTLDLSVYPNITQVTVFARDGDNVNWADCVWDDLRFYPSQSLVTTATYGMWTFLKTSKSDANSMPTHYEYDLLQRLIRVRNYNRDILKEFSYALVGGSISSTNPNSITTLSYRSATDYTTAKDYADGLGRTIQSQVALGTDDIIVNTTYDEVNRPQLVYKPYQVNLGTNAHKYDPNYHLDAKTYYQNLGVSGIGEYPYAETEYWRDPLGRPKRQAGAGTAFNIGSNHEVKFDYLVLGGKIVTQKNDENDQIVHYYVDAFGNTVQSIVDPTLYPLSGMNLQTTFEYDVIGNMTKSTPPNGSAYATTYSYNTIGQLTQKTCPDAGTMKYRYDLNGNLRFIQDAVQAAAGKFTYQKYDAFNRIVEIGEYTGVFDAANANTSGISSQDFPTTGGSIRTINVYDKNTTGDATLSSARYLTGRLFNAQSYNNGVRDDVYYSYDGFGRVEWQVNRFSNSAISRKVQYTYNLQGNITQMSYIDLANGLDEVRIFV